MLSRAIITVLACSLASSCVASDALPKAILPAASPQERPRPESDAQTTKLLFPVASLYKLNDRDLPEGLARYAPLIVVQSVTRPESSDTAAANATGANEPGPTLTVYTDHGRITAVGREFEQVSFAWCELGGAGCEQPRGVRMTLGEDGFPIIWEALDERSDRSAILYISRSFEQAAGQRHGDPLSGRRFAAERSREESPDVLVADVLPDGPVPMGPYVYLTAPPDFAHALIRCRCSSSQVGDFAATGIYAVREIEHAPSKLRAMLERNISLEGALRWPGS